jgi:hypothetical protein
VSVLPGYVPGRFLNYTVQPIAERKLHIAYRGRQVPYWLGELGQDKVRIAEGVIKLAPRYGLSFDVSAKEQDRIYGPGWPALISSAKAVLGTEGGASIWDFDSEVHDKVEAYMDRFPQATFEEVSREVLAPHEGNMMYNTISPRLFEAITLRTAMVMFPGWYNGIVQPDRHYIPLEKDFSNFSEVAEMLKDDCYLQGMVDRTYDEIIRSDQYSEKAFIALVDREIDKLCLERARAESVQQAPPASVKTAGERVAAIERELLNAQRMQRMRLFFIGMIPRPVYWGFVRVYRLLLSRRYGLRLKALVLAQELYRQMPTAVRRPFVRLLSIVLTERMFTRLQAEYASLLRKRGILK